MADGKVRFDLLLIDAGIGGFTGSAGETEGTAPGGCHDPKIKTTWFKI
jgi:hypothetical protein